MSLDNDTVQNIARLARLDIKPNELLDYGNDLSNILDLVAKMDSCDTSGVQPMTHPFDATLRFRKDEVTEVDQSEKFLNIAPDSQDGLYLVPKVID